MVVTFCGVWFATSSMVIPPPPPSTPPRASAPPVGRAVADWFLRCVSSAILSPGAPGAACAAFHSQYLSAHGGTPSVSLMLPDLASTIQCHSSAALFLTLRPAT